MSEDGSRSSAEDVQDASGRQYHLDVAPGEIAPFILLVGDPGRAALVAQRFDSVEVERRNREFVTYTGLHRGLHAAPRFTRCWIK